MIYDRGLEHINHLEGWKTYFKFQHWGAHSYSFHTIMDNLISDLTDYEDYIAEAIQGYALKQFEYTQAKPVLKTGILGEELLALSDELSAFAGIVSTAPGIINIINDFQSRLLRHQYLILLAK